MKRAIESSLETCTCTSGMILCRGLASITAITITDTDERETFGKGSNQVHQSTTNPAVIRSLSIEQLSSNLDSILFKVNRNASQDKLLFGNRRFFLEGLFIVTKVMRGEGIAGKNKVRFLRLKPSTCAPAPLGALLPPRHHDTFNPFTRPRPSHRNLMNAGGK